MTIDDIKLALNEMRFTLLANPRRTKAAHPYDFHVFHNSSIPVHEFSASTLEEGYLIALQFAKEQQEKAQQAPNPRPIG